jgi:cardiolipin synthase (CMP-forming)
MRSTESELGAYLDPLADKLLIVSIYIALGVRHELPVWLVVAVVSRDILILLGVLLSWLMGQPVEIKPSVVSKANTAAQILLAATVLADIAFRLGLDGLRTALVWTTVILTLWSLVAYGWGWIGHMSGSDNPENQRHRRDSD